MSHDRPNRGWRLCYELAAMASVEMGCIAEHCGTKSKVMGPKREVIGSYFEGFNWMEG